MAVKVERASIDDAADLITELNTDLERRYPEESANHFELDQEEVEHDRGAFLVARDDAGRPLGCGAVRVIEPGVAEIKRMFVRPAARGRRIGTALLDALEEEARRLGVYRLVLETGDRQPEALRLYGQAGFYRIERFGPYITSPVSVCLAKDLRPTDPSPVRQEPEVDQ